METTIEERLGNTGGPQTPAEHKRQKGRACIVRYYNNVDQQKVEIIEAAIFHCWGLRLSKPPDDNPKRPGTAETAAVVELANGHIRLLRPEKVQFTDRQKQ